MRKHSGRFDPFGEQERQEHPRAKILINSSREVHLGAIFGFFAGLLIGAVFVILAVMTKVPVWWLLGLCSLFLGLIGGAIIGLILGAVRESRRRVRRQKREEEEGKPRQRRRRQRDDY
jgi:uncharacterized transporter YbjL